MAFAAQDGKKFGNRQKMNAYDSRQKPAAAEPMGGESEGGDINDVVAQHGPAEKIEINHGQGESHVTSHHGGKKHSQKFGSRESAHHHAAVAGGAEGGEQQESPMSGGMEDPGVM